jgi:hypothetical protein
MLRDAHAHISCANEITKRGTKCHGEELTAYDTIGFTLTRQIGDDLLRNCTA